MQWNDPTLELIVPSTASVIFNPAGIDGYFNDPTQCSGLDMAPIRANIEQRPQADGGIIRPSFYDARHITFAGALVNVTGDLATRQSLEDDLIALLAEIVNADGTLQWVSAAHSITVRCDIPVAYTSVAGAPFQKNYVFGLVAADPTIA